MSFPVALQRDLSLAAGEREGDRTLLQPFPAVEMTEFMELHSNPREIGWVALENRDAMQQNHQIAEIRPGQVQQENCDQ